MIGTYSWRNIFNRCMSLDKIFGMFIAMKTTYGFYISHFLLLQNFVYIAVNLVLVSQLEKTCKEGRMWARHFCHKKLKICPLPSHI